MKNRFLVIFAITVVVYFVLDVMLGGTMFYIVSGGVLGSLSVLSTKEMSIFLATLIWLMLLISTIVLIFRTQNRSLKVFLILLIGALLYVINVVIGQILEPFMSGSEEIEGIIIIEETLKWLGIFLKSAILSWVIFKGIIKK